MKLWTHKWTHMHIYWGRGEEEWVGCPKQTSGHLGVPYLAQGYLGSDLKASWNVSCYRTLFQFLAYDWNSKTAVSIAVKSNDGPRLLDRHFCIQCCSTSPHLLPPSRLPGAAVPVLPPVGAVSAFYRFTVNSSQEAAFIGSVYFIYLCNPNQSKHTFINLTFNKNSSFHQILNPAL